MVASVVDRRGLAFAYVVITATTAVQLGVILPPVVPFVWLVCWLLAGAVLWRPAR